MTGADFIINCYNFPIVTVYNKILQFLVISQDLLWTLEILMTTGRDFHNNMSKFFMMAGRDFIMNAWEIHNDWSRLSWCQVENFFNHDFNCCCFVSTLSLIVNFLTKVITIFFFFILTLKLLFWKCVTYVLGCFLLQKLHGQFNKVNKLNGFKGRFAHEKFLRGEKTMPISTCAV